MVLLNDDDSAAEFLDPNTWQMTSVRLPWDYDGASQYGLLDLVANSSPCTIWGLTTQGDRVHMIKPSRPCQCGR